VGIELSAFASRDVFLDYDHEEVTFRWNHRTGTVFRKFYGAAESEQPVPADNRLYNDAVLYGREISKEQSETGFDRR
jgi:hypothetical protein